jgi:hypothetical protein
MRNNVRKGLGWSISPGAWAAFSDQTEDVLGEVKVAFHYKK